MKLVTKRSPVLFCQKCYSQKSHARYSWDDTILNMGIEGSIHSWELVTAVDGPGTRMTVFLSGCPLRCLYCHNPETRYASWGTPTDIEDLKKRIMRYEKIFKATGGGVTISGGEPLMQTDFTSALIDFCHTQGIHVTLDTSGYGGARLSDETIEKLDLILLDVKSGIAQTFKKTTGRPIEPTLKFGRRLSEANKKMWIRFVLVPGLTDAQENVEAVAEYAASLGKSVERLEILPFHQMGRDKWAKLNLSYVLEDTPTPSRELIERVKEQFQAHGLNVTVG